MYLAKHESVEYQCVENRDRIRAMEVKEVLPAKLKNAKNNKLVNALANDVPPHNVSYEVRIPANRGPPHQLVSWRFCGKC